jgi:C2H2-type zinc finger
MKLLYSILLEYNTMDQGEPGVDYDDTNLNPLVCDLCKKTFDSLDKLGEHQKAEHDM